MTCGAASPRLTGGAGARSHLRPDMGQQSLTLPRLMFPRAALPSFPVMPVVYCVWRSDSETCQNETSGNELTRGQGEKVPMGLIQ